MPSIATILDASAQTPFLSLALRLAEARRLWLGVPLDAATFAYRVGYDSPSQFSREYSRHFGTPPIRDIARLRDIAEAR